MLVVCGGGLLGAKDGDVSFSVLLFFGRDSLVLVLIVVDSLVSAG